MRKILGFYICCYFFISFQSYAQQTNNALRFNGIPNLAASYLELPNPRNSLEFETGTVEMWLKPLFTSNNKCFFSEKTAGGTRLSLHMAADNTIGIWNGTYYSTVTIPFSFNTWVHVSLIITTSKVDVYLNGLFQNTINTGLNSAVQGTIPRIGTTGDITSDENWQGLIDEVRIWNVARTAVQVMSDMNDVTTVSDPNLLVYYNFNQGTGDGNNTGITTALDRSTNLRHATLKNFALTAGSSSNFVEYSKVLLIDPPVHLFVNGTVSTSGDGATWATAKKTLTEALTAANTGTAEYTIHIAKGTYKPGTDRASSFVITRDSIKLLGGYLGNETDLNVRNPKNNATILSGDIGLLNNNSDNCNHVLSLVSASGRQITDACVIDGFSIIGGYAQGATTTTINGKIINATSGAGIMMDGSGAGNACNPKINNCIFLNNLCLGEFINDEFFVGQIPATGGAISLKADNYGKANPEITNCVFRGNGGDIMQGAVLFTDCQNHGISNPVISNCVFNANIGSTQMIYDIAAEAGTSNLSIVNCTFYNNSPYNLVTPYGYNGSLHVTIMNAIIQRGSQGIYDESESTTYDISNTTSQFGYEGNNNTASNEYSYFTNPSNPIGPDGIWRTADDGLTLKSCAAAVNSGNNSAASATDVSGKTRIVNSIVDRGAYEGAANMITLSSPAVNNQSFIADDCAGNAWTYYAIPGQPGKLSFAISWGTGNNAARNAATVNINTDNSNTIQANGTTGTAAMLRYWNINLHGTSLNAPVSVRFYYDAADISNMKEMLSGIGTPSEVKWFMNTGNAYSPSQIAIDNINNGNYTVLIPSVEGTQDDVSFVEFSDLNTLTGGTATVNVLEILPVTLNSFTVRAKDCDIQSAWTVSDAVNFKQFEVQRSEDGINFVTIANLHYRNGQSSYQYTDASLTKSGSYLYRLKLVDADGKFKLSVVQAAQRNCNGGVSSIVIGPNPVISECTVVISGNLRNSSLVLYDIYGVKHYSMKVTGATLKIPMASLPAGIYTLVIKSDGGTISRKIMKD